MDHGHILLIKYINTLTDEEVKGKTIIEIGSVREELDGQNSTEQFTKLCKERNMSLVSVDMDEKCSSNASKVFKKYNFKKGKAINMKGEDYIRQLESFDYIYLDGYDYDHKQHSLERNERYNHYFGKEINNEDCWEGHLEMVKYLEQISDNNSVICFDDIISETVGKGVTALPYLFDKKWYMFNRTNTAVILTKKKVPRKHIYVVGNGKSLERLNFEFLRDKEWIGCCLGFRHWEELGFYPKYYVNVDPVVLKHHLSSIKDMIIKGTSKLFLLDASIIQHWPEIQTYKSVVFLQQFKQQPNNPFRNLIDWCSGTVATTLAYVLGFDTINILGMDCKYVEFIPECTKLKDGSLKIYSPIMKNPNYYFKGYQRKGDIYQPPNTDRVHKQSWTDVRNIFLLFNLITQREVMIFNYNYLETLDHLFERKSLDELD